MNGLRSGYRGPATKLLRLATGVVLTLTLAGLFPVAPVAESSSHRQSGPSGPSGGGEVDTPLEQVPLAAIGYADVTLRRRIASTEYFLPGPGDFRVADDNWLELDYLPSQLLTRESALTVIWNGVPLQARTIGRDTAGGAGTGSSRVPAPVAGPAAGPAAGQAPDRARLAVHLPAERVNPDVNRLQVQALLRLESDGCVEEDNPGRHVTIFNSSQVRYSYEDRAPHPRAVAPDLGRYPAPFFVPNAPQPAPVRFIVPAQPTSAEVTALVRVAAQLGQFAGDKTLRLELARDGALDQTDLARSHLIFVGRRQALPTLGQLLDIAPRRMPDGSLMDESGQPSGQPAPRGTGVVLEVASPWNPARMVLAVTGEDDQAVERAAAVMGSRAGVQALRGDFALIPEVAGIVATPSAASGASQSQAAPLVPASLQLADLDRSDDVVQGPGDHTVSFSIDAPALSGRNAMPFDLVVSHSPLLDRARSSFRVVLNGVPLAATRFRDLAPMRATTRVELPGAALKPGANTIGVEFSLHLPGMEGAGQNCLQEPTEQAWAVLHADSRVQPPAGGASAIESPTLASYPYPLVRRGRLDETLLVVPDGLGEGTAGGTALVVFAADLGRAARAEALSLRATVVSAFRREMAADYDVVLWGLPQENPLLAELAGRLPIRTDDRRRLVLSRDLMVSVRDMARLGVVQQIGSPWAAAGARSVLVVTGTSGEGLGLAVEALQRGGLTGNAALASRPVRQPGAPGQPRVPVLPAGAELAPAALQISTYRLPARVASPDEAAARRRRYVWLAAGAVAGAAVLVAGGLAYQAVAGSKQEVG